MNKYTVVGNYEEDGGTFAHCTEGRTVQEAIDNCLEELSESNGNEDGYTDDMTVVAVFAGHLIDLYEARELAEGGAS